jgi:hypothetical protein
MEGKSGAGKEKCHLKACQCIEGWCSRDKCIYWRLLDPQEVDVSNEEGCGLRFFGIVDELDPDTVRWLLDMKEKLENTDPAQEKARITFRRREE